ncbi:hypothetical protein REPUB_Repub04eG0032700 [Reevesia pubescens]
MGAPVSGSTEPGSPRRSYRGNYLPAVALSAWITYLSANSAANLVLSTLLSDNAKQKGRNELIVFWSPFILWHLGSPHNITAYSLEDNDMWLRQFFGLFIQVGEAVYIHMKFRSNSKLSFLAVPVFIAGVFKAGERVWALRCANEKQLVISVGSKPNDEKKRKGSEQMVKAGEVQLIRQAYLSFISFKRLFLDLPFEINKDEVIDLNNEFDEKEQSKKASSVEEAFTLVGIELSFLYDLLFTKFPIHHNGLKVSLNLHACCFLSAVSSLIGFSAFVDKTTFGQIDIAISYMLVVGAISLDIYLFIMHALSKWTIAKLGDVPRNNKLYSMLVDCHLHSVKSSSAMRKMAQHDLISYFVNANESKFVWAIRLIDTNDLLQKHKYTTWVPLDSNLKTFIIDHLLKKRKEYDGERPDQKILSNMLDKDPYDVFKKHDVNDENLKPHTDFSRSVFVWHIATCLVYYHDIHNHRRGMLGSYCEISKKLSDYMLYLVLLRPMMLPKGFGEVINKATYKCAEIFFPQKMRQGFSHDIKQFVKGLLDKDRETPNLGPMDALIEGRKLALTLQSLTSNERWDHEAKWEVISEAWMAMMIKAASNCSWKEHAQQLRHGGELLTHVALLMAHLKLSTKIRIIGEEDENEFPNILSSPI